MKRVVWGEPKISSAAKRPGQYKSLQDWLGKAQAMQDEQLEAQAYLQKAGPAMAKLLELRLLDRTPLIVMRPLAYETSVLESSTQDALDRGFYKSDQNKPDKFINVRKVLTPGTQLMIKALDPQLQEFVFEDGAGQEHSISFDYRSQLMTQTDIFETVRNLFSQGSLK